MPGGTTGPAQQQLPQFLARPHGLTGHADGPRTHDQVDAGDAALELAKSFPHHPLAEISRARPRRKALADDHAKTRVRETIRPEINPEIAASR